MQNANRTLNASRLLEPYKDMFIYVNFFNKSKNKR